jgi:hypothetical protein
MTTENFRVDYCLKIMHRYFIYLKRQSLLVATDAALTRGLLVVKTFVFNP